MSCSQGTFCSCLPRVLLRGGTGCASPPPAGACPKAVHVPALLLQVVIACRNSKVLI